MYQEGDDPEAATTAHAALRTIIRALEIDFAIPDFEGAEQQRKVDENELDDKVRELRRSLKE